MFDKIEKIRKESDEKKKMISFFIALFFTGILFVLWLSIWLPSFRSNREEKKESVVGPLSGVYRSFSSGFDYVREQILFLEDYLNKAK